MKASRTSVYSRFAAWQLAVLALTILYMPVSLLYAMLSCGVIYTKRLLKWIERRITALDLWFVVWYEEQKNED